MGHYEDDYAADEAEDLESEPVDEIIQFAMNEVEGPTRIVPRAPLPYMSCTGCKFFSESMACSGGLRKAPTYYKSCTHPEAWEEDSSLHGRHARSLNTGFGGTSGHNTVTPKWCPFLREKDNVLSNSTD